MKRVKLVQKWCVCGCSPFIHARGNKLGPCRTSMPDRCECNEWVEDLPIWKSSPTDLGDLHF